MNFNITPPPPKITPFKPLEDNLKILIKWWRKYVSTDLIFYGTELEQLIMYNDFIKHYWSAFHENLKKDLNLRLKELEDLTPIQFASKNGCNMLLKMILPKNSNLNKSNEGGLTALHFAVINNHYDTTIQLLKNGANSLKANSLGMLPIHYASLLPMTYDKRYLKIKKKIFSLLYASFPASLKEQTISGCTPLHMLIGSHFNHFIKIIIEKQPDFCFIQNHHGHYPIHTAILNNNFEAAKLLFSFNKRMADILDNRKRTTLHFAARYAGSEMMALCLDYHQNIDIREGEDKTPLMLATITDNIDVIQLLLKRGANPALLDKTDGLNALHYAARSQNITSIKCLVENPQVDINAISKSGLTALSLIDPDSPQGNDIICFLKENGAKN